MTKRTGLNGLGLTYRRSSSTTKKFSFSNFFIFTLVLLTYLPSTLHAEGTATASPTSSNITALGLLPDQARGSYLNAPDYQRIKIRIKDHTRENIYYGFTWRVYGTAALATDVFYRVVAPNGTVVIGARAWNNSGNGFISTYSSAVSGPNINGTNTSGYNALNYNPSQNGDYYIEFWRGTSTTITTSNWATSPYFDITVADTVGSTSVKKGRVNCAKWSFVAVDGSFIPAASASSTLSYYGYTNDSTILKVALTTGFKPIAYDVAVTKYGITNTGNVINDRRSINQSSSPALDSGYRVFLNLPDTNIFTYSKQPTQAQLNSPPILGCSPNYLIRFKTFQPGDVKITLDMNGVVGYQRGTADTIIEIFNVPKGDNTYSWNGRDGLGNLVSNTTNISLGVILLRGRFNLPMYDAEINSNGFVVSSILPVQINNNTLFWNDSYLSNVGTSCNTMTSTQQNNLTGTGLDNKFVGTTSPAHAWNGNGNTTQSIPAPSVSSNDANTIQCDDYGNVRVINTWGWVTSSTASTAAGVGCLNLSGTLWNDVNGSANGSFVNIFTTGETGANTGVNMYATLIDPVTGFVLESVLINSSNGTYNMSSVPKYANGLTIRITNTQGTVGATPPAVATLPSGWTNTSPLTRSLTTTNTALTGIDFGIEQLPTANTATASSRVNPGENTSSSIAASSFGGSDPSSGQIDSLKITTFPSNTTSITIGGVTYTSGTFPSAGVTVSTNAAGQPVPAISIDPIDGAVNVVINYLVKDNANKWSSSTGSVTVPFTTVSVSGTVFNDVNGLTDGNINGSGTNAGSTLFANLINGSGNVAAVTSIASNGTYSFSGLNGGNYSIVLSTTSGTISASAPAASLPSGWVNTAEGTTSTGDGNINGVFAFTLSTASITGINFGIEQLPTANTATASSRVNPGENTSSSIAASSFGGSDPSSGQIDSLKITTFPSNTTSITIGGVTYTSGTFPSAGVTVSTNAAGQPVPAISVDPIDGAVNVVINYLVKDNANKWSSSTGSVTVPFTTVSVSGTVFDDGNGLTDGNINGSGTNIGGTLYANLVNGSNIVVGVATVASNGTYSITGVNNGTYTVVLSTTSGTLNSTSPSASLPSGWVNTAEGTTSTGDGNINGSTAINVNNTDVTGVNFGINSKPVANTLTYTIARPSVNLNDTMHLNGIGTSSDPGKLAGTDLEDGSLGVGSKVVIYTSNGNPLYYDANNDGILSNSELISDSLIINSFNPNLLIAQYSVNYSTNLIFEYAFIDAAGIQGSNSTYSILWSQPLNIQLLDFKATCDNNKITLKFIAIAQISEKFLIYTGSNSESMNLIKSIDAIEDLNTYSITFDNNVNIQLIKIELLNAEGLITGTHFSKNACNNSIGDIKVFPNPNNGIVYFQGDNVDQIIKIRVYNSLSITEIELEGENVAKSSLNLTQLTKGIYFIEMTDEQGNQKTIKISVQ